MHVAGRARIDAEVVAPRLRHSHLEIKPGVHLKPLTTSFAAQTNSPHLQRTNRYVPSTVQICALYSHRAASGYQETLPAFEATNRDAFNFPKTTLVRRSDHTTLLPHDYRAYTVEKDQESGKLWRTDERLIGGASSRQAAGPRAPTSSSIHKRKICLECFSRWMLRMCLL